jgi:hypothetical protein
VASHTAVSAPSPTSRSAPSPPIAVFTQPGHRALTRRPRGVVRELAREHLGEHGRADLGDGVGVRGPARGEVAVLGGEGDELGHEAGELGAVEGAVGEAGAQRLGEGLAVAEAAGDDDDAGPRAQVGEQRFGEVEDAEVVDGEGGARDLGVEVAGHDAGVVDQDVEAELAAGEACGEAGDAGGGGDVEGEELEAHLAGDGDALCGVAGGEQHVVAAGVELAADLTADAAVGPGDEGDGLHVHDDRLEHVSAAWWPRGRAATAWPRRRRRSL